MQPTICPNGRTRDGRSRAIGCTDEEIKASMRGEEMRATKRAEEVRGCASCREEAGDSAAIEAACVLFASRPPSCPAATRVRRSQV